MIVVVMVVGVAAVLATDAVVQWYDTWTVHRQLQQWPGFGPERGVYNFTVVTALFDIGRGWWLTQRRTYGQYLAYLLQILKLDVNLVIFIESKGANFVRTARKGRESRTVVIESGLDDLPCYQDLGRVEDIMRSADFRKDNVNWQQRKAESRVALYDVVTNSKAGLMERAVVSNPFRSPFFIWLDAGLGHGLPNIFPPGGMWHPRHLLEVPDKVTFVALQPMETFREGQDGRLALLRQLPKVDTAPMAGGLFAGGTGAMLQYCRLHQEAWQYLLRNNLTDDDQTTFTIAYHSDPDNFNPVRGTFYDLVKPWT